ncbi:hypothetical protein A5689_17680 [Mycobacterium intracellulare subsp. yongonense]|nr:hypothetical protein A5689_17680 [Mycobacterium intracellulare subsp. yongonense]
MPADPHRARRLRLTHQIGRDFVGNRGCTEALGSSFERADEFWEGHGAGLTQCQGQSLKSD